MGYHSVINNIPKDVAVLGIGNLLLGDEGFGVHVIKRLSNDYIFKPDIELLDGGTSGISLMGLIEDVKKLIVIDCIDIKGEYGSIFIFNQKEIKNAQGIRFSPHQIGLLDVLDLLAIKDMGPSDIRFIGVIGKDFSQGLELSRPLKNVLPKVCDLVLTLLKEFNIEAILKR